MQTKKSLGLTLIEILIALAIVSIALTAIIKAVTQNIRATGHLQDKSLAVWVGQYVLDEARLGILKLPATDALKGQTEILGSEWRWQAAEVKTTNQHIDKVVVSVYPQQAADDIAPTISLEGYVYLDG